ncbi:PAS domain-containing protein [Pseudomonas sp. RC10]|uniref:PAS domain-containing sensor histidine kinase n=1 Tax=Pseudomonas bambusae TaxID=3139142 RepID=UPI00313892A5
MFDLLPVMAWSSFADGTCEFLNKAHSTYTGLSREASRRWGWQTAIHPQDLGHRMEKWRESLASGRPSEAEVRIRRHDGVYRWFLLRVEPFFDASGAIVRWYGAGTDIEDRKHAEANWSASEEKLSLIFNTVPMLVWSCLPDGSADFFNDQWCDYTGTSIADSEGWGWTVALHPDDFRHAMEGWCAVLLSDGNGPPAFELRLRRADGMYRWFWLQTTAALDHTGAIERWYVTMTDIHDRKMAEDGERRSQALLTEAKRLAGLGIFSFREGADSMAWCNALYNMFEFPLDTPVTRELIEQRTHPDDASLSFGHVFDARNGRNFEERVRILMPGGATKFIQYCAYATVTLSGETEYIGTVQDVTEQHLAAEELILARNELAQAAKASSLGVLTASIAHEINQPLSGIVMNANTCLRMLNTAPTNVEGAVEAAQRIIRDGNRAADVVSRLRKLFSQKAITASPWSLPCATGDIIGLLQGDLRKCRISVDESYPADLPQVRGDRIQVQQVIQNLLRNAIDAIKAASDGPRRIRVVGAHRDGFVSLSVGDSGVGFANADPEDVFKTFFTTKRDGMGIGLSISRWIIEAHGGKLIAQKGDGRGAIFTFSIPGEQSPNPAIAPLSGSHKS